MHYFEWVKDLSLNVHGVKNIRYTEMHAAELSVHEPNFLESVKGVNFQGFFQILAELI
jgi:hypothetical protein